MSKEIEVNADDYAIPSDSRKEGYWQKRCEAAEALLKKHYKSIPDSPTYMAWQNSIEPDPDSREVDKGVDVKFYLRKEIEESAPVDQEGQDREAIERACLLALEFGYKQCEKGNNLQAAFLNYNEVVSPKTNKL